MSQVSLTQKVLLKTDSLLFQLIIKKNPVPCRTTRFWPHVDCPTGVPVWALTVVVSDVSLVVQRWEQVIVLQHSSKSWVFVLRSGVKAQDQREFDTTDLNDYNFKELHDFLLVTSLFLFLVQTGRSLLHWYGQQRAANILLSQMNLHGEQAHINLRELTAWGVS